MSDLQKDTDAATAASKTQADADKAFAFGATETQPVKSKKMKKPSVGIVDTTTAAATPPAPKVKVDSLQTLTDALKLSPEKKAELENVTAQIMTGVRAGVLQRIKAGILLNQAKEIVGHTNFTPYCLYQLRIKHTSAQRYRALADNFENAPMEKLEALPVEILDALKDLKKPEITKVFSSGAEITLADIPKKAPPVHTPKKLIAVIKGNVVMRNLKVEALKDKTAFMDAYKALVTKHMK